MNNKLVEYIYPIFSSSISELYTYTTISEFELTTTQIVVAGLSISVVTMILSPLIYKWYSKKREIVLNNNIETLIEKKESLNPSNFETLENSVFKDLAEQMAILVDQRAIEISLSNNSNRTLEKEAIFTISDKNFLISENTEVSEEVISTISHNNEEINSSIPEPLLLKKLPCLNNSSMEALLKELISKDKGFDNDQLVEAHSNQNDYLFYLFKHSKYKANLAEQNLINSNSTRLISKFRYNLISKDFSNEDIDNILTLLKNYFIKELADQNFLLKIYKRSFEYWFSCYTENQTRYKMSEDEAAEKATESWQKYYPNLSNSEEIIFSFNKTKKTDNIRAEYAENILNEINEFKYVISKKENIKRALREAEVYCAEYDLNIQRLFMDNSNLDSETQIQLNTNNLEKMESMDFPENAKAFFHASKRVVESVVESVSDPVVNGAVLNST